MNVWQKPYANNIGTRQVNSGPVVGIDFGTSNSCVSIWNPLRNNAKLIKCDGKKIIQSTLQFYKNNFNEVLVGSSSPDSNAPIVSYIKSYLMDEDYENQKILCVNNANETKSMTAAELITLVLRRLKLYAENYLNDKKHMKIRQAILSMHETKSGSSHSCSNYDSHKIYDYDYEKFLLYFVT
jgi:molecular chaperone DnaK (HSP70)